MLGQLINSLNPGKRPTPRSAPLDSQTEEAHTKSLLFPDAAALNQASALVDSLPGDAPINGALLNGGADCGVGDIDLDTPRDVRIIIGQNFTSAQSEVLLYDSWRSLKPESPTVKAAPERVQKPPANAPQPRRSSSVVSQDGGRRSPSSFGSQGAFQRSRLRNTSLSTPLPYIEETAQSRHREAEDMVKTALDCMFENAQSSYKGPSNRIHIVPLEPRSNDTSLFSPAYAETPSSLGKGGLQRRSQLAKSHLPGDVQAAQTGSDGGRTPHAPLRNNRRRTVLISRMFPVHMIEDGGDVTTSPDESTPTAANTNPSAGSFPFPNRSNGAKIRKSGTLPMYGISIIIQLPISSAQIVRRNRSGYFPPMPHGAGGDSNVSSSFGSEGRGGGWSFVDSMFGVESMLSNSFSSDVDDKVDLIGQHWDIISRTLTSLQFLAQDKIMTVLKPQAKAYRPQLRPFELAPDEDMKRATESAGRRIVRGFKIPRVRTGQNRWGIWREEAIWLGKWAGAREQNHFSYVLLSSFLGQHTDWLKVLGPQWHRKRQLEQKNSKMDDDLSVPCRTVIITDNKMAARRLIFLLSAFLPASNAAHDVSSPTRPSTAASFRGYSQSPPGSTMSRQESLRRTINRRGHGHNSSRPRHASSGTRNARDSADERGLSSHEYSGDDGDTSRRDSRARSILRAPLSMYADDEAAMRKSSATTTSTICPDNPPAPHFAKPRTSSSCNLRPSHHRPGSSGSLASANLVSALQRESTGSSTESQAGGSRWGSLRSFWSSGTRRESSTDYSDVHQSTDEGLGILSLNSPRLQHRHSSNKLEQMIREAEAGSRSSYDGAQSEQRPPRDKDEPSPDVFEGGHDPAATPPMGSDAGPQRIKVPESPFKMSVNEKDGIIDVEIPFPDFTGSPPSGPRSPYLPPLSSHSNHIGTGHHHSSSLASSTSNSPSYIPTTTSFLSFANLPPPNHGSQCSIIKDTTHPLNVAGWLTLFHPDFTLQAVSPYPRLICDVKTAMRAEPSPPGPETGPSDRWVDVCQCLIADTRTWTVKRLSLRRLVRRVTVIGKPVVTPAVTPGVAPLGMSAHNSASAPNARSSRYGNPYEAAGSSPLGADDTCPQLAMSEIHLEEQWSEEVVNDMDDMLVDAVERVVGSTLGGGVPLNLEPRLSISRRRSRATSVVSAESSSRRGRTGTQTAAYAVGLGLDVEATTSTQQAPPILASAGANDVPRECRDAIIGALEKVVMSVMAERQTVEAPDTPREEVRGGAVKRAVVESAGDSGLREGVKRWLVEVEEGAK